MQSLTCSVCLITIWQNFVLTEKVSLLNVVHIWPSKLLQKLLLLSIRQKNRFCFPWRQVNSHPNTTKWRWWLFWVKRHFSYLLVLVFVLFVGNWNRWGWHKTLEVNNNYVGLNRLITLVSLVHHLGNWVQAHWRFYYIDDPVIEFDISLQRANWSSMYNLQFLFDQI